MREQQEIQYSKNSYGDENANHPAFGILSFHRIQGGSPNLFGSSIEHNHKIQLQIEYGHQSRTHSDDLYIGDKIICRAEMSWTQFTQAICDMNSSGVPCTLRFTENQGLIPAIAYNESKKETFRKEFAEHIKTAMAEADKDIDIVEKLLSEKRNMTMAERKELLKSLTRIRQNIGTNLNFTALQFDEQMERSANEAKGEIEAFYRSKIESLGRQQIQQAIEAEKLTGDQKEKKHEY